MRPGSTIATACTERWPRLPDNAWRFAVFSRAALEYVRRRGERPAVIHAHDWQTGLVPVYQKMLFSNDPVIGGVPAVFTIHNLAFQGSSRRRRSPTLGLGLGRDGRRRHGVLGPDQLPEGRASTSASGSRPSARPTRAKSCTPELGFGFDGVLRAARRRPGRDPERHRHRAVESGRRSVHRRAFSADDLPGRRRRSGRCSSVGLPADADALAPAADRLISRLADQKGFDLIAAAADELMSLDAAWVMLGSGEPRTKSCGAGWPPAIPIGCPTRIGFDERLAHLIEAGADMFLMPSRFEPCGLNQMYSLRYGTVPIVRATGGLDDTVEDAGRSRDRNRLQVPRIHAGRRCGSGLQRALAALRGTPNAWRTMQQPG